MSSFFITGFFELSFGRRAPTVGTRVGGTTSQVGGATPGRRCNAVTQKRTPSEVGGDEIKLGGDAVRVSDLRPDNLDGFSVGAGVGSSPLAVDRNFSGLSERGRRLRPAGR
jgi:hypothetical protein